MTIAPQKYRPFPPIDLPDRRWPGRVLAAAPRWCSVDLRDGNQALVEPMGRERKLRLFGELVRIGFKEIEVGFPAASQTDFDFVRALIEEGRVPDDVTLQVLTQARQPLIERTLDAVRGARRPIVHLYNSTSTLQRRVVFGMGRRPILELAVQGTRWVQEAAARRGADVALEYSPESFTGTELDFAREVCDAVTETWGASPTQPMIVNLPATVEMTTPNVYADQIEWMVRHLARRDSLVISVHAHNDRGCAVAATELALLAGAERVEGTLFGNGERTGNADLVTIGLNLFSQGVDPGLDLRDVPSLVSVAEECNRLPVHPRHPYAGVLVFTAFSGSHQDAIRKGVEARRRDATTEWEVPYLPIDPADVGRRYEPLVRINSQSGKGGVAFVLEHVHGYRVPRSLAIEFSQHVQRVTDASEQELDASAIGELFATEYLAPPPHVVLRQFAVTRQSSEGCALTGEVEVAGTRRSLAAQGNGPIDAFVRAMGEVQPGSVRVVDYSEHAIGAGQDAEAVAYVRFEGSDGVSTHGVGRHADIVTASLRAVVSGLNRLARQREDAAKGQAQSVPRSPAGNAA